MAILFQKLIEQIAPTGLRGDRGINLLQTLFGFFADVTVEAARLATKLSWTKSPEQPDDALVLVGHERILNAIPTETTVGYRARLANAWNLWQTAGSPTTIEELLASAGFPLKVQERQDWPDRSPVGYWSLFWLLDDTNSIGAEEPATYDSGEIYGDEGLFYDMTGAAHLGAIIGAIRYAVRKARPAHIVLEAIIIQSGGILYDTGATYNSGAVYDGGFSMVIDGRED